MKRRRSLEVVTGPMQAVEVGEADFSESLAKRLMQAPDRNGAVMKGFVSHACGSRDLLAWAEQFCSRGEPEKDHFSYYEGYKAKPGESFSQQLQRQMEEDVQNWGSPAVVKALFELLQRLMHLHESCREAGAHETLRWKIIIQVNNDGACTKYHDDLVEVRFAMTLAGRGTVLAQQSQVDWDFYASSQIIPALRDENLAPAHVRSIIQTWNQRVCKSEVTTEAGDLVVMKGGKLTSRPCLHRAPYCAGEGMQPIRLLITLDHIPHDELQRFIDMECDGADVGIHMVDSRKLPSGELLPVTILSGFLGAGKTSLLNHVLHSNHGLRVAVIVDDTTEVHFDAMLATSSAKILTSKDKRIEMQNGSICCTLCGDLIEQVSALAAEERFDYLLVERAGISEPMPIATTFITEYDGKKLLSSVARLDTLVTVVDGVNFFKDYGKGPFEKRSIAQLLTDQVGCANLILLNKMDLIKERDAARLEGILKKLNPKAKVIRCSFGKVDVGLLLNSCSFDIAAVEQMPGWHQETLRNHVGEPQAYNISSFVFHAQRPFHPMRLDNLLSMGLDGVTRSKGVLWVAGLHAVGLVWNQVGTSMSLNPGASWLHGSADASNWPLDGPQEYKSLPYGDRRQELVFIGKNLKEAGIRKRLERALVTDAEFQLGKEKWAQWPNPFAQLEPEQQNCSSSEDISSESSCLATVLRKPAATRTAAEKKAAAKRAGVQRKPVALSAVAQKKAASAKAVRARSGLKRKAA